MKFIAIFISFLVLLWAAGLFLFYLHVAALFPDSSEQHLIGDGIVVLTGDKDRIETGLELWKDKAASHIFITGVHPGSSAKDVIAYHNKGGDLPECCISYDHDARNTIENAQETALWIKAENLKTVLVVTSNYHMPRALQEMRTASPNITFIPYPITTSAEFNETKFLTLTFKEYHKFFYRMAALTLEAQI